MLSPEAKVEGDWPFVGREDELRSITKVFSQDRAAGIVVAGDHGVGRTTLAREAAAIAARAQLGVAWVTGTSGWMDVPLGALVGLLPECPPDPISASTLASASSALLTMAGPRGLVIVVDDAHLLDEATSALVFQLALRRKVYVLVTVRAGVPVPASISSLWKDDAAVRIDLPALPMATIEELLGSVLGGQVDTAAAANLAERSRGSALFLRELVGSALAGGALAKDAGVWRLTGRFEPSRRLAELVEGELVDLDPDERSLMELLAYAGVLGVPELDAITKPEVLERLERRGLLTVTAEDDRVEARLAHPVHGEVIRARLPGMAVKNIARRLADVLEASGVSSKDDLRIGMWRLDGGTWSAEQLLPAAMNARWNYQFQVADRLVTSALNVVIDFEASLLHAQLESLQGHAEEAEKRLVELWTRARTDEERGQVAVRRMDNLVFFLGRNQNGLDVASEAEETIQDPGWRNEIRARRSGIRLTTEGFAAAAAEAVPLLSTAEGPALLWACQIAGFALARLGKIDEALEVTTRGAGVAATIQGYDWYPWMMLWVRCEALVHAGRFEEAQQLATSQYAAGLSEGSDEARAYFSWQLSRTVLERGHVEQAVHDAREAVALLRKLDRPAFMRIALIHLALALAVGGRGDEAAEALVELDEMGLEPAQWITVDLGIARGWTAVAHGDLRQASELFEKAADLAEQRGDLVGAATALHSLARTGAAKPIGTRLRRIATGVDGDLVALRASHVCAKESGDAEALLAVATAFDEMGATLLAAEATADAAVVLRRTGLPVKALAAERWSASLVRQCPAARTPALRLGAARALLTPAEQETVLLAARGQSNREIAGTLFLSVRTVENRLQRAYEKLGVSSRAELAELVTRE